MQGTASPGMTRLVGRHWLNISMRNAFAEEKITYIEHGAGVVSFRHDPRQDMRESTPPGAETFIFPSFSRHIKNP
jgi:hypothetical protein